MVHHDHVSLIHEAVSDHSGIWADLGSGSGAFTLALADLLPQAQIFSIDQDNTSLAVQKRAMESQFPHARITYITQDFTAALSLPQLDGLMMANSLHYVADQEAFLQGITRYLKPGGRLVLVEYNAQEGNQWVPYPLPFTRFQTIAHRVGLQRPRLSGTIPSSFLHEIYAAYADTAR